MILILKRALPAALWLVFAQVAFAQNYEVELLGCSSESADFGAMFYEDGVIFCSNRNQKIHKNDRDSLQKYRTDLFFFDPSNPDAEPDLFSKEITTWLNEGPATFSADGQTMYYTGNIEPQNLTKKDKIKVYKLGIFIAKKDGDAWVLQNPFPYNTDNNKYDVAHPTLFNQDQSMIFASNMPGGVGGTDLYVTHFVDTAWTNPVNLGPVVNSENDELFPFVDERGRLFFSSNRGAGDMNIYYTVSLNGQWRAPVKPQSPVNTEFDDFGFICRSKGEEGYFSSNRGEGLIDNLYKFRMIYPDFNACDAIQRTSFCYLIEEEEIMDFGDLPLVYEWDLGDGTTSRGLRVKHCYQDTGLYRAALNIRDTVTNLVYAEVSSTEIEIKRPDQALISAADTLVVDRPGELSAIDTWMSAFDLEDWYWDFGDGVREQGDVVQHAFKGEGVYRVKLGGLSYPDANGNRTSRCVFKDIIVVSEEEGQEVAFTKPEEQVIDLKSSESGDGSLAGLAKSETDARYFIELARSESRIPYNSPVFDKVNAEITERYLNDDKTYVYSVGEGKSLPELYEMFRTLADSGYTDAKTKGDEFNRYVLDIMKKGSFIAREDTSAINAEFRQLQDIKFEYDDDQILEESFANLNYIISMLMVEPSYKVQIRAHTDNIGSDSYNQKLSDRRARSVVKYFEERGIAKDRMESFGYGSSMPVASNESDAGRAQNRRVEFEIVEMEEIAGQ